jgi:hypothetical protein
MFLNIVRCSSELGHPTGGYLPTACLVMGRRAGLGALTYIRLAKVSALDKRDGFGADFIQNRA